MNEIQKSNAKIAIEYYQKLLDGETRVELAYKCEAGTQLMSVFPLFDSEIIRYFWPQEMVEHKGGGYPKPVADEDIVSGKQYYIPDPLGISFSDYITVNSSSEAFKSQVKRGILHETKEAAIAHTKVMLGVSDE
jgi:hypothetical protein